MSCGRPSSCCPPSCCPPSCSPPACCPPIVVKTQIQQPCGQCCVFQLPPVNIVCEIPPPPCCAKPPRVCCIPLVVQEEVCCAPPCPCGPPCCIPIDYGCGKRC